MITGIGIDLVRVQRMRKIRERWGERFLDRVFSPKERAYAIHTQKPDARLSARFAIKEATLKALGIGLRMGIRWRDIETVHDPLGQPIVKLSGRAKAVAEDKQVTAIFASISHEQEYAIAQVILMGKSPS